MIESLPQAVQERVVEELQALVEDTRDEAKWDDPIAKKKDGLIAAASAQRTRPPSLAYGSRNGWNGN
jgi:hypothetical protein